MELVFTDSDFVRQGVIRDFSLDMAYGDTENDFLLTLPLPNDGDNVKGRNFVPELEVGALVYCHGTDIGGIVDTKGFDNTGEVPVMTYSGRTWHGIMAASVTRPNSGQDYLTLTGDINTAINTLITRAGLGAVFSAAPAVGYTVSYQVPRYVSMWEALRSLCKQYGMRPQIERGNGKTVLGAIAKQDYSNGTVSDLSMGLQFERMHRPVNHLVVLGQGELAARTVIDLYADRNGNVSRTQTLFGSDEVAAVYENTSEEDAGKLLNDGIEKLKEYQKFANVGMSLPSNEDFQIGDTVTAFSVETGLVAAAEVVKKVVTVGDDGFAVTDYELGEPAIKAYK